MPALLQGMPTNLNPQLEVVTLDAFPLREPVSRRAYTCVRLCSRSGVTAMRMVNGKDPLPEKPGLGFELSEDALKKYLFTGTRLMSAVFHTDGSVAEW